MAMTPETARNGDAPPTDAPRGAAAGPDAGEIFAAALDELRGCVASLLAVARLEWQRLHLRAIDALLRLALFAVVLVVGLAAAATAGVMFVAGVRDGLAQWAGAAWVGELGAGLLVSFALLCAWSGVRRSVRRRLVEAAVRQKPAPPEVEPELETETS
jgi:hypothetical protein